MPPAEICPCCRARPVTWVWVRGVVDERPAAYWREGLDLGDDEERGERGAGEPSAACWLCMAVAQLAAMAPEVEPPARETGPQRVRVDNSRGSRPPTVVI